jgi:hypothetical protein
MGPLCDPLTTRPIQTRWEFTMEPYPSRHFGFIDDPDRQFGNGSVWTRTQTRSDGPEPLLTLDITNRWGQQAEMPSMYANLFNTAMGNIHFLTIWHRSGGQCLRWVRWYLPEPVKNWRGDHSWTYCPKAVCMSRYCDIARRWPSIWHNEYRKWLGNMERGGEITIAQNGECSQLFGDMAWHTKPVWYTKGIWCTKEAYDSCKLYFRYGRDLQHILVTISTRWCGCS